MASISAADVQALRKQTGAGMLDAKRALEEADGDMERAAKALREKGLAGAAKRADRENEQGAVALVVDRGVAALAELKCETDFVAKSDDFTRTVETLASSVASDGLVAAEAIAPQIDSLKLTLKENIEVGKVARLEAGPDEIVDGYLHLQSGRGIVGVAVKVRNGSKELAHDIALHIAFARPSYLRREEVAPEVVAEERATLETLTRNEGKPEAALPKIVEGRLDGFFKQICLLEQPYIRDEKQSVAQLLGNAEVTEFALVVVGG
ncbi:MAG: translation elongation factor Ts [Acidimicrobiales bacterium]